MKLEEVFNEALKEKLHEWGFNVYILHDRVNILGNLVDIHLRRIESVEVTEAYVNFIAKDAIVSIWHDGTVHLKV